MSADLTVPAGPRYYFRDIRHALDYTVEGFEDFATDSSSCCTTVATELSAGTPRSSTGWRSTPRRSAGRCSAPCRTRLGIPADTVEAICEALCGAWRTPSRYSWRPFSRRRKHRSGHCRAGRPPVPQTYRRLARFALLAAKLGLTGEETEVAFRDQDLVGKFPERLALPPGCHAFDALLPSADGHVYLFAATPAGGTPRAPTRSRTAPHAAEHPVDRFAALAGVDAAFVDSTGAEWLVGRDRTGRPRAFRRDAGSSRWVATPAAPGAVISNNFADPARIDTAFRDAEGKTYLFAGDQYVRYSGDDYAQVDEGYPRTIAGNWAAEGLQAALPPGFETSVDASFHGLDGRAYLFAGGQYAASGDAATRPGRERWGRVRNAFTTPAASTPPTPTGLGAVPAGGRPDRPLRRLPSRTLASRSTRATRAGWRSTSRTCPRVRERHRGRLRRARRGCSCSRTAGRSPDPGDRIVRRVDKRWGQLGPMLPSGTVDAAFVGLDGKTYLFSGDRYVRYTVRTTRTSTPASRGWSPRDWGGMDEVDAAFVLDGRTYLFGTAGRCSASRSPTSPTGPPTSADLDAGEVPARGAGAAARARPADRRRGPGGGPAARSGRCRSRGAVPSRCAATPALADRAGGREPATAQFWVRYSGRSYDRARRRATRGR